MNIFEDNTVLITGAGSDIGCALVQAFLDLGAWVIVTDIDADRFTGKAALLAAHERVSAIVADLADPSAIEKLGSAAIAWRGCVDVLVNNAAIQAEGGLDDCSRELFDRAYAINVRAPYLITRAVVPSMIAAGGGAIINISSVMAIAPGPKRLAYATTKTALLGLTRALAVDLGSHNIRVNALLPGATLTSQLQEGWSRREGVPFLTAHTSRQHPLGRIANVSDIAEAAVFLARAEFVNGIELRVDGGLLSSLRLLPIASGG